jgi:uncharacterized membrane protein required for colicin V production
MNIVDLVIVIILLFFALEGLSRSFIGETLDFLSFLLAFFVSLRFHNLLSSFFIQSFDLPHSVSNVLGLQCFRVFSDVVYR